MESNRSDNKANRSNRQAEKSNQTRSNRVEFANELDANMDKKSDSHSEKANRNSR